MWGPMLDEVWSFLRGRAPAGLYQQGHNIMLYKDDVPDVEVGVQGSGSSDPTGHVVPSALPGGLVATAMHTGPIANIGGTHRAVCEWSKANGYRLACLAGRSTATRPVERRFRRASALVAGGAVTRTFLASWVTRSRRAISRCKTIQIQGRPGTITAADRYPATCAMPSTASTVVQCALIWPNSGPSAASLTRVTRRTYG